VCAEVAGSLSVDEPMSRHCSWRTGGYAERFFEPANVEDLANYLAQISANEAITWIGLGSNVLVRDGGLSGTVISTAKTLSHYSWIDEGHLQVECGTPCAKVAKEAARKTVGGGGFLAGIPGTIGGALAMNAGAFGGDIWTLVESVELIGRNGLVKRYPRTHFATSYRRVDLPAEHWFLSAVLQFDTSEASAGNTEIRELLGQRNASQPTGQASCGSVFKNPPGDYAGRLIDQAGLKGTRLGGCIVSLKHANFIINDKGASAADIENLIGEMQAAVAAKFAVTLELEVRILGRPHPSARNDGRVTADV
jgi:UDP-N-acetylmuramate dehydrogenase